MFGLGQWRLNLTQQQESKCSLWCLPGSHIYSHIFKGNVCFKGIIAIMCKTQRSESQDKNEIRRNPCCDLGVLGRSPRHRMYLICDFCDPPCLCVCLCACVCSEWMPGRKRQRVCGILLSWHNRWYEVTSGISHYEGMHCGRFQDMAADCIHSGRAVNAGLRKLTWIGFGEQCETVQVGKRSTAGCWTRIRGTLGACWWSTVFLLGVTHNRELQSSFNLVSLIFLNV